MSSTMWNVNVVKVETNPENLEACRICLAWDGELYNIRESGLETTFVNLMGTTLTACDGFPQYVCGMCRALLMKAHGLRARCRRADALLKQALMHQHYITNSFIRSVDRTAHNLTYTLSSAGGKVHFRSYHHNNTKPLYILPPTPLKPPFHTNPPNTLPPKPSKPPSAFVALIENNVRTDAPEKDLKLDLTCPFNTTPPYNLPPNPPKTPLEIENPIKNSRTDDAPENDLKFDLSDDIDDCHDFSLDTDKQDKVQEINLNNKSNINTKTESKVGEQKIKTVKCKRKKPKETEDAKVPKKKKETKQCKFNTDDDIKEFEKKYNFEVQILSGEEMALEMEKRKVSKKYLQGTHKCDLCYNGFLRSSIYDNHMRTHDPARGELECKLCHVRYNYMAKLREHVENVHRLRFRCERCNEVVRGRDCAVQHAGYHDGATFQCTHCDKKFLKKTSLFSHMRASHPVENAAGGTCELCGEIFTSRKGLKTHKTRSHKEGSTPALTCRKCRVQFTTVEAMTKHKENRPDKKCDPSLSACEKCGETCANADELLLHRSQQHNVELFTCDICTQSFTSKESVATHIDRMHRRLQPRRPYQPQYRTKKSGGYIRRPVVCEHCGKQLPCQATLKIHMNKHTGEHPYKCTQCPRAYMTPHSLKAHQVFHTGVRKWRCPECPATFLHQSSVYVHRKIHTGERKYQCKTCDKYFTQSGTLSTHIKYVHKKETPPPRKRNKKTAKS